MSRSPRARARALLARLPDRDGGAVVREGEPDALLGEWARALGAGDPSVGALARALDLVYLRVGPRAAHLRLLTDTLACAWLPAADRPALLIALARVFAFQGRHRAAVAAAGEARRLGEGPVDGTIALAYSLRALGRLDESRVEAERIRDSADPVRRAAGEVALGMVATAERRWAEGAACFGRAGVWAQVGGARRVEGIAAANLALAALGAGDPGAARAAVVEARACFTAVADRFHLARLQQIEGERLRVAGDLPGAEAHLLAAAAEADADDDVDFALAAREGLVEVALARGDGPAAALHLDALVGRAAGADDPRWPARVAALQARLAALLGGARVLRLDAEARRVALDGVELDFSRRGPVRRVLLALVRAEGRARTVDELLAAGWPGERMAAGSGAARVYMAVRRLRDLGLLGVLLTQDDGYRLAGHLRVEVEGCEAM